MTYMSQRGEYVVDIALAGSRPQIELIQPIQGPSIYHDWLQHHPYGLHHLGVMVDSVVAGVENMERAGYKLVQSGAGYGLDGDGGYAYFDTVEQLGLIVELIEVPVRRRAPDFNWPSAKSPK
jgi:hypothetical protein